MLELSFYYLLYCRFKSCFSVPTKSRKRCTKSYGGREFQISRFHFWAEVAGFWINTEVDRN